MTERPTVVSGVLAVVAGVAGTVAVAQTTPLRLAVAVAGAGLVVFTLGVVAARSRSRGLGILVALTGLAGAGGGTAYGATVASEQLHLAVVAPGLVGTFLAALGVAPLRGSGSRRFTKIACWLVFLGPVLSAGMEYGSAVQVLTATVAAALVWDLGENSVSLGRQVGRDARTFWNETVHGFGALLMGGVAAGAVYVSQGYSVGSSSLEAVVFLLVSVVLLVVFLHR
ncbi:hypothetical protein EGH25_05210 [Haladaptatus sp. F3-133]|uniref:Uncharacterized protein n=1 Tax=Halorutilus salinus TaxID=2487751 RepID=A0A9Q4GHF8_9EURY|nr:hypothetical protein [Halorutilus salinus]MCX2818750.1 hypothetical protein [Halorutilus salinus]